MPRVVVQHLRLAGPPAATEALLDEVRAAAEQHADCRVEIAAPFELDLALDGAPAPERLAAAAQRVAGALDGRAGPRGCAPPDGGAPLDAGPSPGREPVTGGAIVLSLAPPLGRCAAALAAADRVELLEGLTAVAVEAVRGLHALEDEDGDSTPLARVLSAATTLLPPDGTEGAWVRALLGDGAEVVRELGDLDAPWSEPWRAAAALTDLAALAVQALAHWGPDHEEARVP